MSKLLYSTFAAASLLTLSACGGAKHNVEATLPDMASKTVIVLAQDALGDEKAGSDTIQVDANGHFVYDLPFDHASRVVIYEMLSQEEAMTKGYSNPVDFIAIPGVTAVITGTSDDYKVGGDPFYEEFAQANAPLYELNAKMNDVYDKMREAHKSGELTDSLLQAFSEEMKPLREEYDNYVWEYIKGNPDSDVATALVPNVGMDKYEEALGYLTDRAKNGPLSPLYKSGMQVIEKQKAKEQAAKDMEGKAAPEFSLPNPEGKMISLESLRGKYVLVDFWGSWCGWCIKGIPDMKKAYEKYKDVAEFISVDCRDSEEAWKKALDEHKMPWLQVRCNDDCNLPEVYNVQGYPTKVIIDPEGVYVTAIIGESEEGYKTMEEIFGKKK